MTIIIIYKKNYQLNYTQNNYHKEESYYKK